MKDLARHTVYALLDAHLDAGFPFPHTVVLPPCMVADLCADNTMAKQEKVGQFEGMRLLAGHPPSLIATEIE